MYKQERFCQVLLLVEMLIALLVSMLYLLLH